MSMRFALRSFAALALLAGTFATSALAEQPQVPGTPSTLRVCGYNAYATMSSAPYEWLNPQVWSLEVCENLYRPALVHQLENMGYVVTSSSCKPVLCRK